jgi:N-acetylneuraminic acid mutarotase
VFEWEKVETFGEPAPRCGHTWSRVGQILYLFGGDDFVALHQNNDVWAFNSETLHWTKLQPKGDPPSPRNYHSASVVKNKIYIFGGYNNKCHFNDLHILNTDTLQWEDNQTKGNPPVRRAAHQTAVVGDKIYLFGGYNGVYMDDIHVLDTTTMTWSQYQPQGDLPQRRSVHAMTSIGSKIYLFGGYNSNYTTTLHVLDTETNTWTLLRPKGIGPSGRYGHTLTAVGRFLFLFGGGCLTGNLCDLHVYDTETNEWLQLHVKGKSPSKRQHHAVCAVDNNLWLFGGKDVVALAGVYRLNTSLNEGRVPRFGEELSRHLKRLLLSRQFTDFTIPIQQTKTIELHRFIVSVRCPSLLSNPNLFQEQNLTFEEAMQLLELIYTNKILCNKKVILNRKIWVMARYLEKSQIRFLQQHLKRYALKGDTDVLDFIDSNAEPSVLEVASDCALMIMEANKTLPLLCAIDIEAEQSLISDIKRIYEAGTFDLTLVVKGMEFLSSERKITARLKSTENHPRNLDTCP